MDYTEAFAKAEKQSTLEAAQNSATQAGVHSWHTHMVRDHSDTLQVGYQ